MADDKKPPKSRSNTPRDRDVFVPKRATAPYGVPVVTDAVPRGESWETPDTGTHDTTGVAGRPRASSRGERGDDTPIGLETEDAEAEFRLRNRVKETNLNVKAVKTATEETSTGVTTLRTEMIGHVSRLDKSIGETRAEVVGLSSKVDMLGGHVLEAMGTVNQAVVSLNEFQGVVVENQMERSRVTFETHAKEAVIASREAADAKKQRRSFFYRVGATVLKILGASGVVVATAIATHYAERC